MNRIISAIVIVASCFYAVIDRVAAATTTRPAGNQRGFSEPNNEYQANFENKPGKPMGYETPSPSARADYADLMH
ncbi:MAG: hypothetical protein M3O30_12345 [Planctomycetota bacterium]|nr:hypothetical protein [Planctomycetota bacterium]